MSKVSDITEAMQSVEIVCVGTHKVPVHFLQQMVSKERPLEHDDMIRGIIKAYLEDRGYEAKTQIDKLLDQ